MSRTRFTCLLCLAFLIPLVFLAPAYMSMVRAKMTALYPDDGRHFYVGAHALVAHDYALYENPQQLLEFSRKNGWGDIVLPARSSPLLYALTVPLTRFSVLGATRVLQGVNYLLLAISIILLMASFASLHPLPRRTQWLATAALVVGSLGFAPVLDTLQQGQNNLLVLASLSGCLYAYLHRWSVAAGFFTALAIAIKLFPGVMVIFFVAKRRYAEAAWSLLWYAALNLLVGAIFGMRFVTSWLGVFFTNSVVENETIENQSLRALLGSLFSRADELFGGQGHVTLWVLHLLALAGLTWLAVDACRRRAAAGTGSPLAEFSLAIMLGFLASTFSFTHHHSLLLLVFTPAFLHLALVRDLTPAEARAGLLLALLYAAIACTDGFVGGFMRERYMRWFHLYALNYMVPAVLVLLLYVHYVRAYANGLLFAPVRD